MYKQINVLINTKQQKWNETKKKKSVTKIMKGTKYFLSSDSFKILINFEFGWLCAFLFVGAITAACRFYQMFEWTILCRCEYFSDFLMCSPWGEFRSFSSLEISLFPALNRTCFEWKMIHEFWCQAKQRNFNFQQFHQLIKNFFCFI